MSIKPKPKVSTLYSRMLNKNGSLSVADMIQQVMEGRDGQNSTFSNPAAIQSLNRTPTLGQVGGPLGGVGPSLSPDLLNALSGTGGPAQGNGMSPAGGNGRLTPDAILRQTEDINRQIAELQGTAPKASDYTGRMNYNPALMRLPDVTERDTRSEAATGLIGGGALALLAQAFGKGDMAPVLASSFAQGTQHGYNGVADQQQDAYEQLLRRAQLEQQNAELMRRSQNEQVQGEFEAKQGDYNDALKALITQRTGISTSVDDALKAQGLLDAEEYRKATIEQKAATEKRVAAQATIQTYLKFLSGPGKQLSPADQQKFADALEAIGGVEGLPTYILPQLTEYQRQQLATAQNRLMLQKYGIDTRNKTTMRGQDIAHSDRVRGQNLAQSRANANLALAKNRYGLAVATFNRGQQVTPSLIRGVRNDVVKLTKDKAELLAEAKTVKAVLASGKGADGKPLTDVARAALEASVGGYQTQLSALDAALNDNRILIEAADTQGVGQGQGQPMYGNPYGAGYGAGGYGGQGGGNPGYPAPGYPPAPGNPGVPPRSPVKSAPPAGPPVNVRQYAGTVRDAVQNLPNDGPRLDENLIYRVMRTESSGNHYDKNGKVMVNPKSGAVGLFQILPSTAKDLGIDPYDPEQNIQGGIAYLAQMLKEQKGNVALALAAYNAGPGNVRKYGGIPPFKETRDYIVKILGKEAGEAALRTYAPTRTVVSTRQGSGNGQPKPQAKQQAKAPAKPTPKPTPRPTPRPTPTPVTKYKSEF